VITMTEGSEKYIATDEDILAELTPMHENPREMLWIAVGIANSRNLEPEWLPGPFGNGVRESETEKWGRVIHLGRLRKSLDRLAENGVLVTGTGEDWATRENGRGWYLERRGRYWATGQMVDRWAAEDEHWTAPADAALEALAALIDAAETARHALRHRVSPAAVDAAALGARVDEALARVERAVAQQTQD
jgi:hypothetical protein